MDEDDTVEIVLSARQVDLVNKLARQHAEELGPRQQKPKGMTFDDVINELLDARMIIKKTDG